MFSTQQIFRGTAVGKDAFALYFKLKQPFIGYLLLRSSRTFTMRLSESQAIGAIP